MKIILWIILLVLFLILSLVSLLFIYEDEVKSAIVSELNKRLRAEVKIDPKNINLTIIKTFPDCSIQFKNLLMLEALQIKNRDTLLFAGQLNLHFNIKNIWNKKYEIETISLRDAVVKPVVFRNGKTNYEFWKDQEKNNKSTNDSINFNLKLISVENCRLKYKNKRTFFKTDLNIKKLSFKGNFRDDSFEMESDAKLFIGQLVQGKTSYLKNKECTFSIILDVNDNSYALKKAEIDLNKLGLKLSGKFTYSDSLEMADLKYNAPNLDISSVLSLLPEKFKENINDYKSSGNFYAGGTIRYLHKNAYSIISDFGIKNGEITYRPNSITATDLNLEGYLNYSNTSSVMNLKNIYLNLNNDEIKGNCLINNFSDPYLKFSANANVKLENILGFWPIDTLSGLKGELRIDTEIEGLLKSIKGKTFSEEVKMNLEAKVAKLEAQFKGDEKFYAIENCQISAKEREIEVKDLKLKRGSSDIVLNGKIPGVFNYILDRTSPLIIEGNLFSNFIDMDDFIPNIKTSSGVNDKPLIPGNLNFKLKVAILKFNFGKFEAQSATGEIEIKNQKAMISDVQLETMQGKAEINAFADNSKNRFDLTLQSNLENINITELFNQMNNFNQQTLTDKNLKGVASATVDFSASWDNNLIVDQKSIRASGNLNIDHGELNDFKPLLSLSKYVDVEDLKRIKFSTLQSNIEIKNSLITLPKTSIKNSALNIDVWGTHSFNNEINYHIQLLISELLAKKRKNKDSEFGPIENDKENKRSAFILMTGTLDNPIIKYDKMGLKEKIKSDIRQEKQTIRQLLKDELGLFKKDSTAKKIKAEEQFFELEKPGSTPPKKTLDLKKKTEDDDF